MSQFDVCVIGAGPGGYVAAIRSAQLGLKTCVIEREYMGGVCLNVGCIPSKAMISASHFFHRIEHDASEMGIGVGAPKLDMAQLQKWKQSVCDKMSGGVSQLLKGNGVEIIEGEANFKSKEELIVKSKKSGEIAVKAKSYIIATGSRPIEIPGFTFDEKNILSSTGGLALNELPSKVVVIGGGYIGLEIAGFLSKFGTQITVLEAGAELLSGVADKEAVQVVARKLKKNSVNVIIQAKAKSFKKSGKGLEVIAEVAGQDQSFECDKVLVTVGRKPNSDQLNLKGIGLQIDERGFVKVNSQMKTNLQGIYAIGDIAGQPMLAHKASHEGVLVAEVIAGKNRVFDAKTIPAVIFTDPEIASAGLTEEQCRAKGFSDLKIGKFPFAANGRAVSVMETDGFVKIISDSKTDVVLGVHIVGPEASNLISEAVLAIEMGARSEDIALTIHPHPTLGETMMEAAEATLGHAIHIIQKPLRGGAKSAPVRT